MKTVRSKRSGRFQLKLQSYGNSYYIDRVAALERVLRREPRVLQLDMIGAGEIPADAALVLRSVLIKRSPGTRLVTNARSSLHGGSLAVWLMGDERMIREDAKAFFRATQLSSENQVNVNEPWKGEEYKDSGSEIDPEEGDYMRVLEVIDEFLPVKEMAGRFISVAVLRQFGLVDSAKADHFLAAAFSAELQCRGSDAKTARSNLVQGPRSEGR
jgi:hypothetical protein